MKTFLLILLGSFLLTSVVACGPAAWEEVGGVPALPEIEPPQHSQPPPEVLPQPNPTPRTAPTPVPSPTPVSCTAYIRQIGDLQDQIVRLESILNHLNDKDDEDEIRKP